MQPLDTLDKVFSLEFDTAYFVKILQCYRFYIQNMRQLELYNPAAYGYLMHFLE